MKLSFADRSCLAVSGTTMRQEYREGRVVKPWPWITTLNELD